MANKKKIKNLLIFAHPDDEILGVGGYIAKYSKKQKFKVIFIGEGSSSRFKDFERKKINFDIKKREKMAIQALKFLGINDVSFFPMVCGKFDEVPIINIVKIIEKEIKLFKPDNIFTHDNCDLNQDHRVIYDATLIATRPGKNSYSINKILSCEILSSSNLNYNNQFNPNYFEFLSDIELKKKIKSFNFYYSEKQSKNLPRNKKGINNLAIFRGMQCNSEFAEAYKVIKINSK